MDMSPELSWTLERITGKSAPTHHMVQRTCDVGTSMTAADKSLLSRQAEIAPARVPKASPGPKNRVRRPSVFDSASPPSCQEDPFRRIGRRSRPTSTVSRGEELWHQVRNAIDGHEMYRLRQQALKSTLRPFTVRLARRPGTDEKFGIKSVCPREAGGLLITELDDEHDTLLKEFNSQHHGASVRKDAIIFSVNGETSPMRMQALLWSRAVVTLQVQNPDYRFANVAKTMLEITQVNRTVSHPCLLGRSASMAPDKLQEHPACEVPVADYLWRGLASLQSFLGIACSEPRREPTRDVPTF